MALGLRPAHVPHPHDRPARRYIDPAILLALVLAFFWKIAFTRQYSFIADFDLANQVIPWLQVQAIALHSYGAIALWDPFVYFGQPLVGQVQPGVTSPFVYPLIALPLSHGHLNLQFLNLWFVLIHYCGALFAWFLFRDLRIGRAASITGALFYATAGFVGTITWINMLSATIWTPLVFLFLLRSLRGHKPRSSAAFAGFFLGLAWLSGHHQPPLYLSLAAVAVLIFVLFSRWPDRRQLAVRAAVFLLVTGLTSLLQTLPAAEYARLAVRWISTGPIAWNQNVPFPEHEMYSFRPWDLVHFILPGAPAIDPMVGVVGAILATLAIMALFHRLEVRLFATIGIATILLSMAKNDVLYGIFYIFVPLIEKSREPSRWLSLTHICVAVLVAFGTDVFLERLRAPLIARAARWAGFFALALFSLSLILHFLKPAFTSGVEADDRPFMLGLVAALLAGLFIAYSRGRIGPRTAAVCLTCLMMIELGNSAGYYSFAHKSDDKRWAWVKSLSEGDEIADFLRRQPQPLRASVNPEDLPVNFGDQYGIDTVEAYLASILSETTALGWAPHRIASMLGVNYSVARKPPEGAGVIFDEVFTARNGIKVFRNPDAFPRAWSVHRVTPIQNESTDWRTEAFVPGTVPPLETCPEPDQVGPAQESIQTVDIDVTMACRGLLVVSDSWYPGWTATVDGATTAILKANGAIRGVILEGGHHRVRMAYRPISVSLGFAGTLSGACIAAFLWFRRERAGHDLLPADYNT